MIEPGISRAECRAMRLLAADGWSYGELRMCFEVAENSVRNHVNGECVYHEGESDLDVDPDPEDVPALGGRSDV